MSEMITVPGRDIQAVTTEIKTIVRQTREIILSAAIEIGRCLVEAKSMVEHGEWGAYLQNEVEFSQSSANNFMRLYEEFGNQQESLFHKANSETLGNLPYSKVLKLLAVPEEDREEFVKKNDVEAMSVRELDKAIKERDAAVRERDVAQAALKDAKKKAFDAAAEQRKDQENIASLQKQVQQARETEAACQREITDMRDKLAKAKRDERAAKDKVRELEKNQDVPADVMASIRKEAEAAAAEKARKEMEAKITAAEQKAQSVAREKEMAEQELADVRKKVQLSDPDGVVLQTLMEQVQQDVNRVSGVLLRIAQSDPQRAVTLRKAVAALLEKLKGGFG